MKSKILTALRNRDGYVSGQELCEQFEVTRTAIWKGIKQLKEEGYGIEAVQNKGYRLTGCPDTVSGAELKSRMDTKWAGREVVYLYETDSTNNDAKRLAEEGAKEGTLVVADFQSGGKGRRGRSWVTPHKTSIAMSIIVKPQIRPDKASMLTLVIGMAAAKAIQKNTGLDAKIKWPNDVVVNGKKVTGILTELSMEMERIHYVVIGTGINANVEEFPEELGGVATSLLLETGKKTDRAAIICDTMKFFEEYYEKFVQAQDMGPLMEEYNGLLINRNRGVRVLEPGMEFDGTARGIDELGRLLVETQDGSVKKIYAGEVSVRGIYNYV